MQYLVLCFRVPSNSMAEAGRIGVHLPADSRPFAIPCCRRPGGASACFQPGPLDDDHGDP